ncbi:hypothetical protein GCM10009727_92980 [Actinomadura napierensis]|uniref:Uncharacterized protein n=1 Tax=Actinomadura napierensis TaxID=267854 RepID=A0ABN3AJ72_9ACTN
MTDVKGRVYSEYLRAVGRVMPRPCRGSGGVRTMPRGTPAWSRPWGRTSTDAGARVDLFKADLDIPVEGGGAERVSGGR